MGSAPASLPPNEGRDLFSGVTQVLSEADLRMGNLEQTLTEDTGTTKCSADSAGKTCFAFRTPPGYASVLKSAGFDLMAMANNHAYDFGQAGYQNTRTALEQAGLRHTGAPDEITVVPVNGIQVAVLGFSPYTWSNDINSISVAKALVAKAATQADLVVVHAHMGAEGADKTHVRSGTETYLGENRGDPVGFAHAVVEAGADLVIGHGPHVMRGMEFYQGRLIAYSLGNFTGYRTLSYQGVVGVGGVLRVTLRPNGEYVGGKLISTVMVAPGIPQVDASQRGLTLVGGLSTTDFGASGARFDSQGQISPT